MSTQSWDAFPDAPEATDEWDAFPDAATIERREAITRPVENAADTRSRMAGTGSVFADSALAAMGGEGGAFADPNATGADIARRAAAHAAVFGAGAGLSGGVVPALQAAARSYLAGVGGGLAGKGVGETLEASGMAPAGTGEAFQRAGNVVGAFVGPTAAGGKLINFTARRIPIVGRAVAPAVGRILGTAPARVASVAPAAVASPAAPVAAGATPLAASSPAATTSAVLRDFAAGAGAKPGAKVWMLLDKAGAPIRRLTADQARAAARRGESVTWARTPFDPAAAATRKHAAKIALQGLGVTGK
jgi:hypothetical protein